MRLEHTRPIHSVRKLAWLGALLAVIATISCGGGTSTKSPPAAGLEKINHVIVVYQENWSFDGLYGKFPGANGIANAGDAANQVDKEGRPLKTLARPLDTGM